MYFCKELKSLPETGHKFRGSLFLVWSAAHSTVFVTSHDPVAASRLMSQDSGMMF